MPDTRTEHKTNLSTYIGVVQHIQRQNDAESDTAMSQSVCSARPNEKFLPPLKQPPTEDAPGPYG